MRKSLLILLGCIMAFSLSCQKNDKPSKKNEQQLRINLNREPHSLDPRKGSDAMASMIHFMLFEGLTRLNPDLTTTPAQAESIDISEDRLTYIFHLRDCKWSDGTSVTSYDYEKTWKDCLDPRFIAPDAYLLYPIKNAELAKRGEVPISEVGIASPDPKTLVVTLLKPTPHFLQVVASGSLLPINQTQEAQCPNWAADATEHFVSNGPFKLVEWQHNNELSLIKNPLYRNAGQVKLDNIQISIVDNEMASLHMYATGYFDIIGPPLSNFPVASIADLTKKNLIRIVPVAGTKFTVFNTRQFPFTNVNMRKAFGYAINRQKIIDNITQLQEPVAQCAVPPVLKENKFTQFYKDEDIKLARECFQKGLSELGIQARDLGNLTFTYFKSEVNVQIAQDLQQQWFEALGVKINIESVDFKTLHEKARSSNYSIMLFAWLADCYDPMNILERMISKDNIRNYSKWENQEYNALLEKSNHAATPEERMQYMVQAEALMLDNMPITPIHHWNFAFLVQPYVKDFSVSPLGHIQFDKISIDPER